MRSNGSGSRGWGCSKGRSRLCDVGVVCCGARWRECPGARPAARPVKRANVLFRAAPVTTAILSVPFMTHLCRLFRSWKISLVVTNLDLYSVGSPPSCWGGWIYLIEYVLCPPVSTCEARDRTSSRVLYSGASMLHHYFLKAVIHLCSGSGESRVSSGESVLQQPLHRSLQRPLLPCGPP